jgi:hypothetical protein
VILASTASATGKAKRIATVDCLGASVTLIMHPGEGGTTIWDISAEDVSNGPNYLLKRVSGVESSGGQPVGTIDTSFGNKNGFGEPITCDFQVHGEGFDVIGTLELVQFDR